MVADQGAGACHHAGSSSSTAGMTTLAMPELSGRTSQGISGAHTERLITTRFDQSSAPHHSVPD